MSGDHETYEWHECEWGIFRCEQKRFGTWVSYGKNGEELITCSTKEVCIHMSRFHLENQATNRKR